MRTKWIPHLASVVLVLLAATACAGGDGTGAASTDAENTGSPAGAAPTVATDSPAATPTGSPGTEGAPADAAPMRIGHEAPLAVTYLPMVIATDRLSEEGYDIELVPFEAPDAMAQALADGSIDVASSSTGTALAAIDAGLDAKIFMGLGMNVYQMAARTTIEGCEGFADARVGIHSYEGTTGSLTTRYFEEQCPDVEPNILVVPGSENRLAGLLADQLDATAMDIPSAQQLILERPDDFHILEEFGDVQLAASAFFATTEYLDSAQQTISAFVSTYSDVLEEASGDQSELIAVGEETIPELDPQVLRGTIETFVENELWQPADALEEDLMASTIELFGAATPYENITGPEDVVDRSFLEES